MWIIGRVRLNLCTNPSNLCTLSNISMICFKKFKCKVLSRSSSSTIHSKVRILRKMKKFCKISQFSFELADWNAGFWQNLNQITHS